MSGRVSGLRGSSEFSADKKECGGRVLDSIQLRYVAGSKWGFVGPTSFSWQFKFYLFKK